MIGAIRRFGLDESGATAIEYGMIAGLISMVIVTFVLSMGHTLVAMFTDVIGGFASVN
ncbi:MAG: Flp family type IVb pilin [Polyangiaceae bacterium]